MALTGDAAPICSICCPARLVRFLHVSRTYAPAHVLRLHVRVSLGALYRQTCMVCLHAIVYLSPVRAVTSPFVYIAKRRRNTPIFRRCTIKSEMRSNEEAQSIRQKSERRADGDCCRERVFRRPRPLHQRQRQ